jgi:hypothetical protein
MSDRMKYESSVKTYFDEICLNPFGYVLMDIIQKHSNKNSFFLYLVLRNLPSLQTDLSFSENEWRKF